jgi:hypothetical protein
VENGQPTATNVVGFLHRHPAILTVASLTEVLAGVQLPAGTSELSISEGWRVTVHEFIDTLLNLEAAPVITVTVAREPYRPRREFRIRTRNLVAEARRRVEAWPDRVVAERLLRGLDEAAHQVESFQPAKGAVLVVTPELAEAHNVWFPVRDDVSLGATPATRYLVQGLRRSPRYRTLVISDRGTRLFECVRDVAVEVRDHGFPMAERIAAKDRRAVAGRFALPTGRDRREPWRRFYRNVDAALAEASRYDELPLVLVGVRRSTRLFRDISRHAGLIVGYVDGAHDDTAPQVLADKTWQVIRKQLQHRRVTVVGELAAAVASGSAATGIDDVWQLAREGRGRLLVVEEEYRAQPSIEVDGRLIASDGAPSVDVMDDPVDELIEHVVRAGGTVEFLARDALADFGRIGLFLR